MRTFHQIPTRAGTVGDLARMIARLIGPGYQAPDGSLNGADDYALASSLGDEQTVQANSGQDAFPSHAVNTLAEWETVFGLPVDTSLTDAARRQALTTRTRARLGGTPQRLVAALSLYDATVSITETTLPTGAFRFGVVVSTATFADTTKVAAMNATVQVMKPAHTRGRITTGVTFRCADVSPGNPLAGRLNDTLLGS